MKLDNYYPFGLAFNSYQRENSVQNKYLFNGGSELQTDLNLGWYSTLFRIYDPAIGRFLQVDSLADFFSGITPYNFTENNPVLYGDPSGLSPTIWPHASAEVTSVRKKKLWQRSECEVEVTSTTASVNPLRVTGFPGL